MTYTQIMQAAFQDELQKLAGESRIGRKPIGIERLLEREAEVTGLDAIHGEEQDEETETEETEEKTSAVDPKLVAGGSLLAGAGLYHIGRKANNDRKLGRAIRIQNQAQGQ